MSEFVEFPKIARLSRECVVTEKIDGTNAQVYIAPVGQFVPTNFLIAEHADGRLMFAGSRTRYVAPEVDNFGFARWVKDHAYELWALGEGRHYGEWWGSGIQRSYGLLKGEKRFSLFNVARWHQADKEPYVITGADPRVPPKVSSEAPACCHVVPVLYRGEFSTERIGTEIERLRVMGSVASPGFMPAEGLIVYHTASGQYYKKTVEKDEQPKGRAA